MTTGERSRITRRARTLWDDVVDAARRGAAVHLRTGSTYEALRLAELGLQEVDADAVLLELAMRAAWACGLLVHAANYASQWAVLAEAGDNDGELSRALRALARLKWEVGDTDEHAALVTRLLSVADGWPMDPTSRPCTAMSPRCGCSPANPRKPSNGPTGRSR